MQMNVALVKHVRDMINSLFACFVHSRYCMQLKVIMRFFLSRDLQIVQYLSRWIVVNEILLFCCAKLNRCLKTTIVSRQFDSTVIPIVDTFFLPSSKIIWPKVGETKFWSVFNRKVQFITLYQYISAITLFTCRNFFSTTFKRFEDQAYTCNFNRFGCVWGLNVKR